MLEVLKRINTLAQKEREQFNKTLMGVTIYDPTGEDVTPEKLKEEQQKYFD